MNRFILPLLSVGLLVLSMICLAAAQPLPRRLTPPPGSVSFGASVAVLANGNIVVTDPDWTGPGNVEKAGAVYLYDGATLEVISTLTGSHAGDRVGSRHFGGAVAVLPNGCFVVCSPDWNGGRGAVTWCSGTGGPDGPVSSVNSLIGSRTSDFVGSYGVAVLPNGSYAARSADWNEGRGAVTWSSAATGVTGEVTAANSLTGVKPRDKIGNKSPWHLTNGKSLWLSPEWNGWAGALTLMNADGGPVGEVTAANSLVNTYLSPQRPNDGWLTELDNGNFVVCNPAWNRRQGAVTWVSGTAGLIGAISEANSLIGSRYGDEVGSGGIIKLANGNYVVRSPDWNVQRGAFTWGDGAKGLSGVVSKDNSLVNHGPYSLSTKSNYNPSVTALANGNYVAAFPRWGGDRGAVVWGSGTEGVQGEVSDANALTGILERDCIAWGGVTALANGNYVVISPLWNNVAGAVTWCDGSAPATGQVTTGNSLTGTWGRVSCTALKNGHYVVCSPAWGSSGAVAWGNGVTGLTGELSSSNALTGGLGISPADYMYSQRVVAFSNGNYVVVSPGWHAGRGAVTWCDGSGPLSGEITAANSLTGDSRFGAVGGLGTVELGSDRLLVMTPFRNTSSSAVAAFTWIGGAEDIHGEISADNSLLVSGRDYWTEPGGGVGVTVLPGGAYTISLPGWNEGRGAVIWGSPSAGARGEISAANALTGTRPEDAVGSDGVKVLDNGAFLVKSRYWNNWLGAWTWGSLTEGVRGEVSAANSHLGTPSFPTLPDIITGGDGSYAFTINTIWTPPSETEPRGLFVAGDGETGGRGYPTLWNSLRGSPRNPAVRPDMLWDRTLRRWIVCYAPDNAVVVFEPARVIGVSGPQGVDVRDETIPARRRGTDFGAVLINASRSHIFTVADAGIRRLVLTGDPPVRVTGANAAEFTVTRQPRFPFTDDASFTFEITFKPAGPGPRTAVVSIASNADGAGWNPYTFPVLGTGVEKAREVFEDWRAASFGTAAAATAPAEDFDGDSVSNLLEFAFGTDPADSAGGAVPLAYSGPLTAPGGGILTGRGGPIVVRSQDGTFAAVWLRRRDTLRGGLKYTPQFSAGLQTWQAVTAQPVVLASDGFTEAVALPFPADPVVNGGDGGQEKSLRFFRLAVTLEP